MPSKYTRRCNRKKLIVLSVNIGIEPPYRDLIIFTC